jgi:hypothetical protein
MTRLFARLIAAAACLPAASSVATGQAPNDVAALRWMAGCWELRTPARVTHEQWMAPLGGMMMGMSRTVVRDVVREYEALRIALHDGVVTYVAQPSGQARTRFGATMISDTTVTFANPAHDFPQRIIYRRRGADSLVGRIEGERSGSMRGVDFPMRRVLCGG